VWTGQVNFTDSSDVATTGVATLTLTPDIGVSNLPALVSGDPGLPPTLRNVTVNQVPYGTTPSASTWTLVTAGGPGVASEYDLTLYVNSGAQGPSGTVTISTATDLLGTPTDKYTLVYNSATSKWKVSPMLAGDIYEPSTINSFSGNAAQATLATITVPAQPFDWRPEVSGYAIAGGTIYTRVELAARLNNATSGDQIGYAPGTTGTQPPPMTLVRTTGPGGSSTFGKVSAGSAATIYFLARQTAATTDAWNVNAGNCRFSVKVNAIP
jgi:hypothetical protein